MWKYIAGTIAIGSVTYGLMRYFAGGVCHCTARLDGLVVVITGANSGIGKALALELGKRGATLVLACRSIEKGLEAKLEIQAELGSKTPIHVKYLDLNSLQSIQRFADNLDSEFDEIYALVNNAGVFYHPQALTKDGFDVTFQTNYLGAFYLTHQLLRTLKRSDHARVVNVASEAHHLVNVYDLNCLTFNQGEFRTHFIAYGVSKLALVLFTREFAKRITDTNIIINAADPGNVETQIFRYFPQLNNHWLYLLQWPIRRIVVKRPAQGVQPILHALLTSNRSTGQYIKDCNSVLPSQIACDDRLARKYYKTTKDLLRKHFTESEC